MARVLSEGRTSLFKTDNPAPAAITTTVTTADTATVPETILLALTIGAAPTAIPIIVIIATTATEPHHLPPTQLPTNNGDS
jgi:hypothetical protein